MQQLNEHDAGFWATDSASSNANLTLLHIYDQSTAPCGRVRFKDILAHIESRLDRLPRFRQKLLRVPLELDFPYWVDDQEFSLDYHVRHIALPQPGDWRQFCIQASRLHARALDLGRPLWELYVIEGLDCFLDLPVGSFAVVLKVHTSMTPAIQAHEITALLHDLSAQPNTPAPQTPWFPDSPPSSRELLSRAWLHALLQPWRSTPLLGRVLAPASNLLTELSTAKDAQEMTRFNSVVSPYRVFDTRRFNEAEFEAIQALVDGTCLDDAVLAVCSGGLRRYLALQAELPDQTLTVAVSASDATLATHSPQTASDKTQLLDLHTDKEDAMVRLAAIQAQQAVAQRPFRVEGGRGPKVPPAHCTLTHVPGPHAPLYLRGARMTYFSAILPIADGMGLSYAVTCYDGKVVISFASCHEQLPDPEVFAQCLRDSFQEYLALATVAA